MKKILFVVIGILIVLFILSFLKDTIIKVSFEKGVGLITGLKLRTHSFRVGIINTLVGIKRLQLFNPEGYKDRIMLDMPEIYVDYSLGAFFKGKVHLNKMRINMREFMVVKNEKGKLNLDSLNVVRAQKEGKKPDAKGKLPKIQIDELELKIGKVIYKDYSKGGVPSVKEFNINVDEKYKNITNPYALVSLIVVRAMVNTTIANLIDFDLNGLQGTISDTLTGAQEVFRETTQKTKEAVKETVKETQETLKKATEGLKDIFK